MSLSSLGMVSWYDVCNTFSTHFKAVSNSVDTKRQLKAATTLFCKDKAVNKDSSMTVLLSVVYPGTVDQPSILSRFTMVDSEVCPRKTNSLTFSIRLRSDLRGECISAALNCTCDALMLLGSLEAVP